MLWPTIMANTHTHTHTLLSSNEVVRHFIDMFPVLCRISPTHMSADFSTFRFVRLGNLLLTIKMIYGQVER